jgi:thioesterase domain-containing protein
MSQAFSWRTRRKLWNADSELFTVSGFSVGGNLALAVAQSVAGTAHAVNGFVGLCAVVQPPTIFGELNSRDPLFFLQPLFDAYAGPNRLQNMENPILHPILADIQALPQNMFFIIAGADILLQESKDMVQRLEDEARAIKPARVLPEGPKVPDGRSICVRNIVFERQLHGWLDCEFPCHHIHIPSEMLILVVPSSVIDVSTRTRAFGETITFLCNVHRAYGYNWRL